MQKTTFLGLQSIVKCVDARLKQLESLSDNVNKYALYLIQEIELKLPACFINQEIINNKLLIIKLLIIKLIKIKLKLKLIKF